MPPAAHGQQHAAWIRNPPPGIARSCRPLSLIPGCVARWLMAGLLPSVPRSLGVSRGSTLCCGVTDVCRGACWQAGLPGVALPSPAPAACNKPKPLLWLAARPVQPPTHPADVLRHLRQQLLKAALRGRHLSGHLQDLQWWQRGGGGGRSCRPWHTAAAWLGQPGPSAGTVPAAGAACWQCTLWTCPWIAPLRPKCVPYPPRHCARPLPSKGHTLFCDSSVLAQHAATSSATCSRLTCPPKVVSRGASTTLCVFLYSSVGRSMPPGRTMT